MRFVHSFIVIVFSFFMISCGGGGGGSSSDSSDESSGVDITDSASLSRAASFEGGTRVSGSSPVPSDASGTAMEGPGEMSLTTNSVTELTYEIPLPDTDSKVAALLIQFAGSDEFFYIIPDEDATRTAYRQTPRLTAHSDLARARGLTANRVVCAYRAPPCEGAMLTAQPLNAGSFPSTLTSTASVSAVITPTADFPDFSSIPFAQVQPDPTRWTTPIDINVTATPTGSGDFQITLVWDSTADMDLHIFEPSGTEIAYTNRYSEKGYLDIDDIDGYGPENVFYENGHDSGSYRVEVHHFSGELPTSYTVTITDNGSTTSYSGNVTGDSEQDIVTTVSSNGSETTESDDETDSSNNSGSGNASFCYDGYPSQPCDALVTSGGASSSDFTTSNTCSGLGYSGASETYDFESLYGSFGSSSSVGTVGTCEVTF
jgi:hypothetical protein